MNNKGFAITTILYGVLILFLMLLVSMLGILSTYKDRLELLIESNNGARDIINYRDIGYWDPSVTSGNSGRMTYTINNEVVTVTAIQDNGYGYIPYYVDLIAGKTYIFNCSTNGRWFNKGGDVEAFLMLNGTHVDFNTTTVHLQGNNRFYFTAPTSGKYWLRFDVNTSGNTFNFSNIKIIAT